MKYPLITVLALATSLSAFAEKPTDTSCEGQLNKRTRVVVEKTDDGMKIQIIRKNLLGKEKVIAEDSSFTQFRQNLDSNGPYLGYENKAYGDAFVHEATRERATLYYSEKIQLKIPYTAPGKKMSDPRESTLIAPELLQGPIPLQCKILIFG